MNALISMPKYRHWHCPETTFFVNEAPIKQPIMSVPPEIEPITHWNATILIWIFFIQQLYWTCKLVTAGIFIKRNQTRLPAVRAWCWWIRMRILSAENQWREQDASGPGGTPCLKIRKYFINIQKSVRKNFYQKSEVESVNVEAERFRNSQKSQPPDNLSIRS